MIDEKDLEIEENFSMRFDQPSCSVTVTHIPTGIKVSVQKERQSRDDVRRQAIKRLEEIVDVSNPMAALIVDLEILASEWLNEEGVCPNSSCSNLCYEVENTLRKCAYELDDVIAKYQ